MRRNDQAYFNAFIGGGKHGKLIFLLDPLGLPRVAEEVALLSYGDTDAGNLTAFHLADEYSKGTNFQFGRPPASRYHPPPRCLAPSKAHVFCKRCNYISQA